LKFISGGNDSNHSSESTTQQISLNPSDNEALSDDEYTKIDTPRNNHQQRQHQPIRIADS